MQSYQPVIDALAQNQSLFRALGDMERQRIIILLATSDTPLTVGDLAKKTDLSRPAISHHIKILRESNLLRVKCKGVRRYYRPYLSEHITKFRHLIAEIEKIDVSH